jgi:hypothetical protein
MQEIIDWQVSSAIRFNQCLIICFKLQIIAAFPARSRFERILRINHQQGGLS